MTKSKSDKQLTLSYKKLSPKVTYTPCKGVGNGKIDVFKELTSPFADLLSFTAKEKNKKIK